MKATESYGKLSASFAFFSFLSLPLAPLWADFNRAGVGTASGQFLKLGADARSAAMGQAAGATAEDATAIYWNPAGLASISQQQVHLSHTFYPETISHSFIGYAIPLETTLEIGMERVRSSTLGALGVGILHTNSGTLEEVDNQGIKTGSNLKPRDLAGMLSWGLRVKRHMDLGITLKYVDSKISQAARTGAVDLGGRWVHPLFRKPYALSLGVQNLGGRLRFNRTGDPLPLNIRLGQSFQVLPRLLLSLDLNSPRDNNPTVAFGTEFKSEIDRNLYLAVRAGYNNLANPSHLGSSAGFSFGIGFGFKSFWADYAGVPMGLLGNAHRLSLSWQF